MEFRNVLLAIVLSAGVLIGWAMFFEQPPIQKQVDEKAITKN